MYLLLTTKQVADALGISMRSLERMRSEGTGPKFIRTSGGNRKGRVDYMERDVNEWLDARRRASTSDPGP
jgi:predicted DNA-binding transcriptional regulator AlpA